MHAPLKEYVSQKKRTGHLKTKLGETTRTRTRTIRTTRTRTRTTTTTTEGRAYCTNNNFTDKDVSPESFGPQSSAYSSQRAEIHHLPRSHPRSTLIPAARQNPSNINPLNDQYRECPSGLRTDGQFILLSFSCQKYSTTKLALRHTSIDARPE